MAKDQTRWDVTVYRGKGDSTTHENLTDDQALKLENQAFTDKRIVSVESKQR
jgi:hypothetical protein